MSLDMLQVIGQVQSLSQKLKAEGRAHRERLDFALRMLPSLANNLDALKAKVERSKTTWLVAGPGEGMDATYNPPAPLSEYAVIATDGSHIPMERHRPVRCYLINTGAALIHYGQQPSSQLVSFPALYSGEAETSISNPSAPLQRQPVEGDLLGARRAVEECRLLARLAGEHPAGGHPVLCLLDGSLILWGLGGQGCPDFVTRFFLQDGLLKAFDSIRQAGRGSPLSLASYISYPHSTEVVNTLRVALCPHDPVDCDLYCSGQASSQDRPCSLLDGLQDQELFFRHLSYGQRSPLFGSRSSVVEKYYGEHSVYFFYLNVGQEIARVEVPRWVAEDPELVVLAHFIALDQCRRGLGYPVALSEAHEKAVIPIAEREEFWKLVEAALDRDQIPIYGPAKAFHKKARFV